MSLLRIRRVLIAVVTATALAACGGGGDGGNDTSQYDLQAAMATVVKYGLSDRVTLSGSALGGLTGTGTFDLSIRPTQGTFNGTAALLQTQSISGTLTGPGQSLPFDTKVTNAYDSAGAALLGMQQLNEVDVAQSPITFPKAVPLNATPLGTMSRYTDATLSVVLGTTDLSVEVALIPVDPGSPEVVRFTFKTYDASHALVQTDTFEYVLSRDSVLSFLSARVDNAHGTLSIGLQ